MQVVIGERLRKVRQERGISQKKLGLMLGLSDKAVSAYESGRTFPPLGTLFRIAKELGCDITYFFTADQSEANVNDQLLRIETLLQTVNGEVQKLKKSISK